MASRESLIDEASRPLMSAAGPQDRHSAHSTTPFFTPPPGRYGEDEDEAKKWPLNVVLLYLFRVLIVVLALVAFVRMLKKRAREGQEAWEVVLIIVGSIQILWNLAKLVPWRLWRCGGGRRGDGKRTVECTVGAYRVVLLLARADEDLVDDAMEPPPPKPSRGCRAVLKKSAGDLLVTLLLLICTTVYAASYHYYYTEYFVSAMTGLYFTIVVLQALCVALPYLNTCGPLSITVNYSGRARRDYQYQIQLPQDEARKAGSGKQPISVSAV